MPENLRKRGASIFVRDFGRHDRTGGKFVQIGSAYAAGKRLDLDLTRTDSAGFGDLFDANVLSAVITDGLHLGLPPVRAAIVDALRRTLRQQRSRHP